MIKSKRKRLPNVFLENVIFFVVLGLAIFFFYKSLKYQYPYFEVINPVKWDEKSDLILFESYSKDKDCTDPKICYQLLKLYHSGRILMEGDINMDSNLDKDFGNIKKLIYESRALYISCSSSTLLDYPELVQFHVVKLGSGTYIETNRYLHPRSRTLCLDELVGIRNRIISIIAF